MRTPTVVRSLLVVVTIAFLCPVLTATGAASADGEEQERLVLVLDSSGSMKDPDRAGVAKIAAAKEALRKVVDGMPADAQVGMRVYGATVFDKSEPGACRDSQLAVPIGTVDKAALRQEIASYTPYGETPIAYALEQAAADLGPEGKRRILLVSDGQETCDRDPCKVARKIHQSGIELKIDVVGMSVKRQWRSQLECIADAGGGTYCETGTTVEVVACFSRTALRDVRAFSVTGDPVEGGLRLGEAPEIGAGHYTDSLGGDEEESGLRYYRVPKSPGSTVHAAVTARTDDPAQSDGVDVALLNAAGQDCASGGQVTLSEYEGNPVINASVIFAPGVSDSFGCDEEDAMYLEVRRGDEIQDRAPDAGDLPMELVVGVEPEVTNLTALPAEVAPERIDDRMLPPGRSEGNVVGGVSFSSAPELEPGGWSDTLQTGEMLFYRVSADWGQAVRFSLRMRADPALVGRIDFTPVTLFAYAPDRTPISLTDSSLGYSGSYTGNEDVVVAASLPEIRYRNREHYSFSTTRIGPTSLAGDYYFAVHLRDVPRGKRFQVQTEIAADVRGEPSGVPEYAEEVPTSDGTTAVPEPGGEPASTGPASARAGADDEEGSLPVAATAAAGGSTLVLLVVGTALLARRRFRGRT